MLGIGLLLLWWITGKAGGLGPVLSAPSKFHTTAEFVRFFIPSLTGMVGFWATVALNIPDFTRYAKSQKAQMWGQALGLPAAMTLYSFIGVAVTSASVVLFGEPIWDPVVLLGKFNQPVVAFIALVALLRRHAEHQRRGQRRLALQRFLQSQSAPDFLPHRRPDHRRDRRPHDALEAAERFQLLHFRLAGGLLRPARADRRRHDRRLFPGAPLAASNVDDLYRRDGVYEYENGVNLRAVAALVVGHRRGAARPGRPAAALALRLRLVRRLRRLRRGLRNADAARATSVRRRA